MVVISAPGCCAASVLHDLMARPLTSTVQAPHWAVSQPTWVPVSRRCSRIAVHQQRVGRDVDAGGLAVDLELNQHVSCLLEGARGNDC
jgi:hypothetical protein